MPLQAWIDDSGAKGQRGWLTLGGLSGTAENWGAFSDRWAKELKAHPRIDYLSTSDAAAFSGEFYGWPAWQRDAKVARLVTIANDLGFTAISASVDLAVHASLKGRLVPPGPDPPSKSPIPRRRRTFSEEPYFFLFHNVCSAICLEMLRQGVREEIDLIFDNQDRMKPRILEWYPMFLPSLHEHERAIMPSEPLFRDDQKFMPLQMADFVAWVERADLNGQEHPFKEIAGRLKRVQKSRYSSAWTVELFNRAMSQDLALSENEMAYGARLRAYLGLDED